MGNTIMDMLFGQNMGVNFNNMNMDQKRQALRGMTKGTMLGGINPELPMPIQLPDATAQAAMGGGNPMLALSALQGLLSPQQPQFMPLVQQQVTPGLNIPMSSMNQFYGGLL